MVPSAIFEFVCIAVQNLSLLVLYAITIPVVQEQPLRVGARNVRKNENQI